MLINFVDATNDANHYTKPPPLYLLLHRRHLFPPVSSRYTALHYAKQSHQFTQCVFTSFHLLLFQRKLTWRSDVIITLCNFFSAFIHWHWYYFYKPWMTYNDIFTCTIALLALIDVWSQSQRYTESKMEPKLNMLTTTKTSTLLHWEKIDII